MGDSCERKSTLKGLHPFTSSHEALRSDATLSELAGLSRWMTQGSSFLATLGFVAESLRDSPKEHSFRLKIVLPGFMLFQGWRASAVSVPASAPLVKLYVCEGLPSRFQ